MRKEKIGLSLGDNFDKNIISHTQAIRREKKEPKNIFI